MPDSSASGIGEILDSIYRSDAHRILATLIRLLGDFDVAEEAMHDAFAAAMETWTREGVPANPRAVLENEVIPLFYDRGKDGIPHGWLRRVRHSMASLIPQYNTDRMVMEYTRKYYVPKPWVFRSRTKHNCPP